MKKTFLVAAAIMLSTLVSPTLKAALVVSTTTTTATVSSADLAKENTLIARVNEIKAMDKSNMSQSEKKGLRKELRSLKTQLKSVSGGGVYLSVGAIIIIILLLILLL